MDDPRLLPEEVRKRFLSFPISLTIFPNLDADQEAVIIRAAAHALPLTSSELTLLSTSPAIEYVKSVQDSFLEPNSNGGPSPSFDRILGYHLVETSMSRTFRTWACLAKAIEGLAVNAAFEYIEDKELDQWLSAKEGPNDLGKRLLHRLL